MNMNTETYEVSKDEAQTLNIEELVRYSSVLASKLRLARKELGEQRVDLERLRDGKLALRMALAEANDEIGRLVTALAHEPALADEAERAKEALPLAGK